MSWMASGSKTAAEGSVSPVPGALSSGAPVSGGAGLSPESGAPVSGGGLGLDAGAQARSRAAGSRRSVVPAYCGWGGGARRP